MHKTRLPNGLTVWMVTGHDDVRAVLTDPRISKDLRNGRTALAAAGFDLPDDEDGADMNHADPPVHTRLRSLVARVFTGRRVRDLEPWIQRLADELVDGFGNDGLGNDRAVDLIAAYAAPLPVTVICELLGVPAHDRALVRQLSTRLFAEENTSGQDLRGYIADLVREKRQRPDGALLSDLVEVSDGGDRLSAAELASMTFLLLVAGHETTVNLIGNGVHALLTNPGQRAMLAARPELLGSAVEEFLRYDPPVRHGTFRCAVENVEIGDETIPAGAVVVVDLAAANRDARQYMDPNDLAISRKVSGHLAFGHGIHHCVGAPLARTQGRIAIATLLRRLPAMTLAGPPSRRTAGIMSGFGTLPVAW
ncbi:cytochrome P450 [Fodinicola feengrottensis]|uniref:Cytochrome P450 n=1 Tax=Fodinicola feengrottensis TaxID=435914 RepID=A0ABP4V169_9ACTN